MQAEWRRATVTLPLPELDALTRLSSRPKCEARRAGIHRDGVVVEEWVPDSAARFRDDKS